MHFQAVTFPRMDSLETQRFMLVMIYIVRVLKSGSSSFDVELTDLNQFG